MGIFTRKYERLSAKHIEVLRDVDESPVQAGEVATVGHLRRLGGEGIGFFYYAMTDRAFYVTLCSPPPSMTSRTPLACIKAVTVYETRAGGFEMTLETHEQPVEIRATQDAQGVEVETTKPDFSYVGSTVLPKSGRAFINRLQQAVLHPA